MVLYDAALSHTLTTFKFIKMGKISLNFCSPLCLALKRRKEWCPPDVFSVRVLTAVEKMSGFSTDSGMDVYSTLDSTSNVGSGLFSPYV